MAKSRSVGSQIILELLEKFPNTPTLTLAKKAYKENSCVWSNLEACRSAIRQYRGNNGEVNRKETKHKDHYKPNGKAGEKWADVIPPPLKHFEDWKAVQYDGPLKALVLSDIHIPYHDSESLGLALDYGLEHKANFVLLNGDIIDNYGVSHWETDPRKRNFAGEIRSLKTFLSGIRRMFPRARICYHLGNHEERYERYMIRKAPELLDVPEFKWEHIVGLSEEHIELVKERRPVRLGELNVIHGHEYKFQITSPVNPARGIYLRAKTHALAGHFHQTSQHSEKSLEQKVISTWSTGALCDLHYEHGPLNNHNHGFAFVEVGKGGSFQVDNHRIINGKIW